MSVRIQLRRDTAANWTATNPTLTQGEPGYEIDTGKIKYGDGSTAWNSLAYAPAAAIVDGTIVNADINASAAIAGTKISPNFGSQNISTTGTITTGAITLPNTDGTNGQVLSTNGSGTLSWATAAAGGASVTTSDTAPSSPSDGDLWYDSVGGRTYVYYDDGNTSQWVDASPQGGGGTSGKILQVVTATYNTQTNFTTTTMTDIGLSASITPSSASNQVLVLVNLSGLKVNNPQNSINFQLLRGATVVAGGGQYNVYWVNGTANAVSEMIMPSKVIMHTDSPSSTSALTYKVQACARTASTTVTLNLNDGGNAAAGSTLILMEVAP